ncbi:hypothetical protein NQZ68_029679 [Dissostichus eleginoides]|nr:hypothetical protein NQZ68_029679 [Dissostichus eleginoides]
MNWGSLPLTGGSLPLTGGLSHELGTNTAGPVRTNLLPSSSLSNRPTQQGRFGPTCCPRALSPTDQHSRAGSDQLAALELSLQQTNTAGPVRTNLLPWSSLSNRPTQQGRFGPTCCPRALSPTDQHSRAGSDQLAALELSLQQTNTPGPVRTNLLPSSSLSNRPTHQGRFGPTCCPRALSPTDQHSRAGSDQLAALELSLQQTNTAGPVRTNLLPSSSLSNRPTQQGRFGPTCCPRALSPTDQHSRAGSDQLAALELSLQQTNTAGPVRTNLLPSSSLSNRPTHQGRFGPTCCPRALSPTDQHTRAGSDQLAALELSLQQTNTAGPVRTNLLPSSSLSNRPTQQGRFGPTCCPRALSPTDQHSRAGSDQLAALELSLQQTNTAGPVRTNLLPSSSLSNRPTQQGRFGPTCCPRALSPTDQHSRAGSDQLAALELSLQQTNTAGPVRTNLLPSSSLSNRPTQQGRFGPTCCPRALSPTDQHTRAGSDQLAALELSLQQTNTPGPVRTNLLPSSSLSNRPTQQGRFGPTCCPRALSPTDQHSRAGSDQLAALELSLQQTNTAGPVRTNLLPSSSLSNRPTQQGGSDQLAALELSLQQTNTAGPRLQLFDPSSPERLQLFDPSSPERLQLFDPSSPERLQLFDPSSPERLQLFDPSSPERLQLFDPSSPERLQLFDPSSPERLQLFDPSSPERLQLFDPSSPERLHLGARAEGSREPERRAQGSQSGGLKGARAEGSREPEQRAQGSQSGGLKGARAEGSREPERRAQGSQSGGLSSPRIEQGQTSLDMAGLKYLATALETMEDPENPECESEGFLLEKGVKETFADLFVKMKMLRGGNEVEGGEAAEAT